MDREIQPIPDATNVKEVPSLEDPSSDSTGRHVARATAGIGALHFLRLLAGFIAQPLIANRFGLTSNADVYTVAVDVVSNLWRFFEKIVNPTFLPCFMAVFKDEGEERAWSFTSTILWLTLLALFPTTIAAWIFMPQIVGIYSIKASLEQQIMTVGLARQLLPGLLFLGVSSLTYVILNGYKRFLAAALGDTFWKVGILVGALISTGLKLPPLQSLQVIAFGFLGGTIFKIIPHIIALRHKAKLVSFRIDWRNPLVKKMILLAIPLVIGIVSSEGRDIYLKRLADSPLIDIEGSRTALKFSRTIGDNLLQIFPYALSIGIFPYLAGLAHQKDRQKLTDTLIGALRVCIWTFTPITAIMIALHFPLLRAIWESGHMDYASTSKMSRPFIFYSLGLVGFSCEMMLNQTFYALTNVWVPTLMGLMTTALNITLATIGIQSHYGLAALAGAESVSKTVKCLILWAVLYRHLGDVRARKNLVFFAKVVAGALIAGLASWMLASVIIPTGEVLSRTDKIRLLGSVAVTGLSGLGIFVLWSRAVGIEEAQVLIGISGKIKRRLFNR